MAVKQERSPCQVKLFVKCVNDSNVSNYLYVNRKEINMMMLRFFHQKLKSNIENLHQLKRLFNIN